MVGWHHRLNGHESEQTLGDSEGQERLACCSPWSCRVRHDLATEQPPYSPVRKSFKKLNLEKAEEPEIKLPTQTGSSKKQESFRKASASALLTMPKPLTVWTTKTVENSERDGNTRPPNLPLEKSVCRSGSNS